MYTKWTSHLQDEHAKAQFEIDVRRAKPVLERLKQILDVRVNDITDDELSRDSFEKTAWPYWQASVVGARRELTKVIQLIDLDKQKDTE